MSSFPQISLSKICLCNSNEVAGELRGKPISTSLGCDEIDYPQAEHRRLEITGAASHLCACPALISVYFCRLSTMCLHHAKKPPTPLIDFKSRNRKHPFLGKPEVGSLHHRAHSYTNGGLLCGDSPSSSFTSSHLQKLMQQWEMIVDAHY